MITALLVDDEPLALQQRGQPLAHALLAAVGGQLQVEEAAARARAWMFMYI